MTLTVLDRINLCRLGLQTTWREYFRWKGQADRRQGVRCFYGFDHIPMPHEQSSGGIIKVQDLQNRFPNTSGNANILYLVSSCLPEFAVNMVKFAQKAGAKVVLNQNGVAYPAWYGKGFERVNRPMSKILHMSDYVIYQSRFCRMAADKFLGERDGKKEILYNPVDTNVFKPDKGYTAGNSGSIKLLLAGSHQSFYRVRVALESFTIVLKTFPGTDIRLIIAGRCVWERDEKQAVQQIKKLISELGIQDSVGITGSYTQKQAPDIFRSADILLHTKYNDPCPRLVVEAMACGLPVVCSASGGVPELIGDDAGRGVTAPLDWEKDHPPDSAALAEEIINVLSRKKEYAQAARKRAVDCFDVKPWLDRHEKIFQMLLDS